MRYTDFIPTNRHNFTSVRTLVEGIEIVQFTIKLKLVFVFAKVICNAPQVKHSSSVFSLFRTWLVYEMVIFTPSLLHTDLGCSLMLHITERLSTLLSFSLAVGHSSLVLSGLSLLQGGSTGHRHALLYSLCLPEKQKLFCNPATGCSVISPISWGRQCLLTFTQQLLAFDPLGRQGPRTRQALKSFPWQCLLPPSGLSRHLGFLRSLDFPSHFCKNLKSVKKIL